MAWASTVAVVVPSPATSEVLLATSFTICAPMFSNLLSSSTSFATVTPSLVMVGEPKLFSMTTLRPFGPSVTLTTSASVLTPLRMTSRAFWSNRISLEAISLFLTVKGSFPLDDAEYVFFADDEALFTVELDLDAGVFREEDAVAGLHVERADLAALEHLAVARGDHLALDRLLLGRVGDDDPALGLLLLRHPPHDDAVLQRSDLHGRSPLGLPPAPTRGPGSGCLGPDRNRRLPSATSTAPGRLPA